MIKERLLVLFSFIPRKGVSCTHHECSTIVPYGVLAGGRERRGDKRGQLSVHGRGRESQPGGTPPIHHVTHVR